jgi:stage V sporulation protein AE
MDIFLTYLIVFAIGGAICVVGQVIMNCTKLTPARILVGFMLAGAVLQATGAFKYMQEFAKAGVTVPILGFGSLLVKGAVKGVQEKGFLGAIGGGLMHTAIVLSAVIFFAFLVGLIFKPKTKK